MPSFWSLIENEEYKVGCTGQTVYVYDKEGNEKARFKDLIYAYLPVISPHGDSFVVKSTEGRMAVYSLETFSLVRKFRYSRINYAQDEGCCFSPDGSAFYSIEFQGPTTTALSIYDTADFSLKKRILDDDPNLLLKTIRFENGTAYLLGVQRGEERPRYFFVARLIGDKLEDLRKIPKKVYNFYHGFLNLEAMGFTKLAKQWSGLKYDGYDLSSIQDQHYTLEQLWMENR